MAVVTREGDRLVLPGIASAHSHAFQRGLRGRTHTIARGGSFWSWRGLMYQLAGKLDPESIHALSFFAFVELAKNGVTEVGEFHYVHHQPDGTPYVDRLALSDAVVRAALDAGIRVTLLRVIYERAGWGRELDPVQRRFADPSIESSLADVDALVARWKDEPRVRVGLAPHSVRAVTKASLAAAAAFATARGMPLHAHVAEQPREIHECLAEHGMRPVELLGSVGALTDRFVAVHGTHLAPSEVALLRPTAGVCVCRTTERDLGDGAPDVSALVRAGVPLSTGVDSHAASDPFEEARAIELDERTRTGARAVALDGTAILRTLGEDGHRALGVVLPSDDRVVLDGNDAALVGADPDRLDDAVAFAATGRAVREVVVAGTKVVEAGCHAREDEARRGFELALRRLV